MGEVQAMGGDVHDECTHVGAVVVRIGLGYRNASVSTGIRWASCDTPPGESGSINATPTSRNLKP